MAAVKSRQKSSEKATSSRRNELKFGMVTNNHRLFSKMQKYGIPKFWSQWHFNNFFVFIDGWIIFFLNFLGTIFVWAVTGKSTPKP